MDMTRVDRDAADMVGGPDTPERREGKRHTSVLLIGRADFAGREHACLVHNISERGLMARFLAPPAVGDSVVIQLRGLAPATAVVRWVRDPCAGMEFAEAQRIDDVLHPSATDGLRARTPRFDVSRTAMLEVGEQRYEVLMVDVSVGGAKLLHAPPLRMSSHACLRFEDSHLAIAGTLCWQDGDRLGFRFVRALTLQKLSDVLALQDA